MAAHSSVIAWRIPGTGEPGGLPSLGSHRVGHHWSDLAAAGRRGYWKVWGFFLGRWKCSGISGNGYTTLQIYWKLLSYTLENWENEFYVMSFWLQFFRRNEILFLDLSIGMMDGSTFWKFINMYFCELYILLCVLCCCSDTKLCLTLQPHKLQYARLPCPSLFPGVCSDSCSFNW